MKKIFLLLALIFCPVIAYAAQGALGNAANLAITTGGTWQTLFAVNNNRSTLWIENPCTATSQGIGTAESLFLYFIPTGSSCLSSGTAGAFELGSCGSLVMTGPYISQQAVCVYAATTSHAFEAAQTK